MRLIIILLIVCIYLPLHGQETFTFDNIERSYYVHIPDDLPAQAPLVFVLHGYTSTALAIRNYCQMNAQANLHKFVVVYPQGTADATGTTHWNANLNISTTDDIGFLSALAVFLQNEHNLNPAHTFTCGMSNGGFMSYTLACERPDIFKAIASVTGTMSGYDWQNCNPSQVVPVFQISGTNDNVVPFTGPWNPGGGWGGAPGSIGVSEFWRNENQVTDSSFEIKSNNLRAEYYTNGNNGNEVWFYPIETWGHAWPGSWSLNTTGISASEEIWKFFSLLINQTTSVKNEKQESISFFPNPVQNQVNLISENQSNVYFQILNSLGQEVLDGWMQHKTQINLTGFSPGIYFLKTQGNTLRFIKLRN